MNDLISRQAAIDTIKGLPHWIMDANGEFQSVDPSTVSMLDPDDAVAALENLPPEEMWVSCSERLPEEEEKSYWVCLDGGGQCQCRWTNNMYGLGANEWDKWGWHVMDKPQYSRIIAWMPLPEPYEESVE